MPAAEPRPSFLGGFRSGSTLLINLLGLDPRLTPWFETKCLAEAFRWLKVLQQPSLATLERGLIRTAGPREFTAVAVAERMHAEMAATAARIAATQANGKAAHERYPIGSDAVCYGLPQFERALALWRDALGERPTAAEVARATGSLVTRLAADQCQGAAGHGASAWVNKTPELPRFAAQMADALGPVRVILMVRDGLDVVESAHQLGWASIGELARWWRLMIEDSRAAARDPRVDYLEVRYEDLMAQPVLVLEHVLSFLGRDVDAERLVTAYREFLGGKVFACRQHPIAPEHRTAFDAVAGDLRAQLYPGAR